MDRNLQKQYRKIHNQVTHAIKKGLLVRKSICERCGSRDRIEGHHEDYGKPLDVVWLCQRCHQSTHNRWFGAMDLDEVTAY